MKYLLAPALALTLSLGLTATPALAQSDDCYPGLGLCEDAVTAKTPLPSRINIGTPEAPPSPLPQTSEQPQPQTQPSPAAQVCVVYDVRPPDAWLALRTEPTTKRGRRLYKLPSGTRLEMLGAQEGNWHLVRVSNGSVGWVSWYRDRWIAC